MREARGELPGLLCACACSLRKNKKNKFLKQKQVVDHPGPCVFLHMVGVKHVAVLLGPCVFLLVS